MEIVILESGGRSLNVTRFSARARAVTFLGTDRYPPVDEKSPELSAEELANGEEGSRTIVLSIHPLSLSYREIELPLGDRRKIRDILPLELKGETAVDTKDSVFDVAPMEDGKYLVAWGKRKQMAEYLESMTRAGLEPRIVTSAPLHRHFLLPGDAGGCTALSDGAAMSVFRNRKPVYFRALSEGGINGEIEKTLAAFELGKGIKVESLFLFGDAVEGGVCQKLKAALPDISVSPLPVTGNLLESFAGNRGAALTSAGAWALANEVASGDPVNFRYGDLAYTAGFEKTRKRLRFTAALAVLIILLLFAESGIRYFLVKKDLESLDRSIMAIYHEVFPTRAKAVDEVAEMKSEIKRMGGDAGTPNILPVMKRIAELKGDGISGFYEAEFDGNLVRLKGEAESFQAVNDFRMRTGSLFASAEVGEIKSKPGGGVSFSFRGVLREAGI